MSLLEREIRAQGDALGRRGDWSRAEAAAAAAILRRDDVDYVIAAGRGSSDNAARFAQYMLGARAGVTVGLAAPWLFGPGHEPPRLGRAAVLAISQSGQSPDIGAVLSAARDQGRPTIVITNEPTSAHARLGDVVVELRVAERSVAATGTYTGSLHAVMQIAAELGGSGNWDEALARIPGLLNEFAAALLDAREGFDPLAELATLTALGRGLDYATAFETALKIRELSGKPAEAFSPPDLLHGPIAGIGPSTALWVTSSAHETAAAAQDLLRTVGARAGRTVAVSADPEVLRHAATPIPLPAGPPECALAIAGVLPAQVTALRLAELADVDVDAPHGLHKVTATV
jgi:glutamine---fructose-6-phosphate transaminase (isomerizing)